MPDIKAMAVEAGIDDSAPLTPYMLQRLEVLVKNVARECEQAVFISSNPSTHEGAHVNRLARQAIRARFGLEG